MTSEGRSTAHGPAATVKPSLRALPREQWDHLLKSGQGGCKHAYLSAWEKVRLRGLRSRPLAIEANGSVVAAAPAFFYDLDLAQLRSRQVSQLVQQLRRAMPRLALLRVYELGSGVGLSDPLLLNGAIGRGQAARLLLEAAAAEAERGKASVVVIQDFPTEAGDLDLAELGFAPVNIPPTVVLELGFESFDHYLAAMRAPYRRRARRVIRASASLHVERRHDFHDLAPELARLAELVFERADEVKREILTPDYFRLASDSEDTSLLLLKRGDGSIASFALMLHDRPWLHFLNCGFAEEAGREEGAYFRLLYEIVRAGIDDGLERINFGITTLAPKLDVGGVPVPLTAWMRYHRPVVQELGTLVVRRLFPPCRVKPRRVFKDPQRAAPAVDALRVPDSRAG